MIEGIPSQTAFGVAFARAIASLPHSGLSEGRDTWAAKLLPRPYRALVRGAETFTSYVPGGSALIDAASLGMTAHAGLRTAAIDAAASAALARGVTQLVVLGAGLDARAYRLPALRDATVFEVDHPSTQAWKKKRIGASKPLAKSVTYVTMDFAKDSLDTKLEESGHDAKRPTIWLWEGVTMYLPPGARESTMRVVASRTAKGSRLIETYVEPAMSTLPGITRGVVRQFFSVIGEPLVGLVSRAEIAIELTRFGFTVVSDEGTREWAVRYANGSNPLVGLHERVVVADRL
jgi:methyltransferase (TIGR00027 family)